MDSERIKRLSKHCLGTLLVPFGVALLLKLSSAIQHFYIIGWTKEIEVPSLEHSSILLWVALLAQLPLRLQLWVGGVLVGIIQSVFLVDATYYRFFQDLPSLYLLPTWFQAARVGGSLATVFRWADLMLLIPPAGFVLVIILARKWPPFRGKPYRPASLGLLLCSLGFAAFSWQSLHPVRYIQLQRRFQNKAIQKLFGPQFYHYYDLYEWSRVQLGLEGGRKFDAGLVRGVLQNSRDLSTADTPFKGIYKDRDLIFVQLESLEDFAVDAEYQGQPVMPFLNQASQRVFRFRLFDQTHLGRSADGQFIYLNSLHPPATRPLPFVYPNNDYHGLPKLLSEQGYETYYFEPVEPSFWNAGTIARSYGFEHLLFKDELPPKDRKNDIRGWGLTDKALYRKVAETLQGSERRHFSYVVTVMCHHPYSETSNVPVDFPPRKAVSMVRRYLRCAAARDKAIRDFMMELSLTERGRRTVFVLAGDHDANLPQSEMKKLGYPISPQRESVPVLMGSVEEFLGFEQATPTTPPRDFGAQMDLAPTIGHVFSLNMEESVFVGWNLLATQNRGPHFSRLGNWMDQTGTIQVAEDENNTIESPLFEASEMLLQSDKIKEFSVPFN